VNIWTVILSTSISFITVQILINKLIKKIVQQEEEFLNRVKEITIRTINEKMKL